MGRRRGLSMVELIIATGLLATSLFFVLAVFPTSNASLRKGEDLQVATAYALEIVEETREAFPDVTLPNELVREVPLNGGRYKLVRTLRQLEANGTFRLCEIVVQVERLDTKAPPVKLVTRVALRDVKP